MGPSSTSQRAIDRFPSFPSSAWECRSRSSASLNCPWRVVLSVALWRSGASRPASPSRAWGREPLLHIRKLVGAEQHVTQVGQSAAPGSLLVSRIITLHLLVQE